MTSGQEKKEKKKVGGGLKRAPRLTYYRYASGHLTKIRAMFSMEFGFDCGLEGALAMVIHFAHREVASMKDFSYVLAMRRDNISKQSKVSVMSTSDAVNRFAKILTYVPREAGVSAALLLTALIIIVTRTLEDTWKSTLMSK